MVDESLIAYLKTQLLSTNPGYIEFGAIQAKLFANDMPGQLAFTETTNKSRWTGKEDELEAALRHLIHYNNDPHPFNEQEVQRLIFAMDHCKILDPACGSGAFPMGVLHKLVYLLGKLDERNIRWRELQKMKAIRDTEEAFNIGDVKIREDKLMEINETFENNAGDYGRKLYLIENCIYGVDIQAIAVQISKLRFFISLVVDQKEREWAENRGIRPLPNLETKFVAANTLIGLDKPTQLVLMPGEIETLKKELRQVRHRHFEAKSRKEKLQCQKRDKAIRQKIAALLKNSGWANKDADNIAVFDIYDQYNSAPWFDPEWMFGIKDGFDITIGNPPYFNISTVSKELVNTLSAQHKAIHTGYNDIVYYFIYLGIELLKKTGCCALITSNYYLGNEYAKKIRLYLKDHTSKIINFKDHMVFDAASVHTCISISYKEPTSDVITFFEPTDDKQITSSDIEAELKSFAVKRSELKDNWIVANQSDSSIFEKLKQGSLLLGDIAIIEKGSTSGKNDIFTISYEFAEETKMEPAILRKNIKNGDIDRYVVRERGNSLIYVDNNTNIEHFPNVYSYLKKHKEVLSNRNESKQGLYPWYRLERPRNKTVFDAHEKIVVPYRAEKNRFAYDNNQYFNDGGDIRAIVISNSNFNIKYVLAILNSRLIDWFYGFIGKPKGKVREYFNAPLSLIPIKQCSLTDQQPFSTLVDQILAAKTTPPSAPLLSKEGNKGVVDTSALEKQIDEMVYALYDLTPEEIGVVEGKG